MVGRPGSGIHTPSHQLPQCCSRHMPEELKTAHQLHPRPEGKCPCINKCWNPAPCVYTKSQTWKAKSSVTNRPHDGARPRPAAGFPPAQVPSQPQSTDRTLPCGQTGPVVMQPGTELQSHQAPNCAQGSKAAWRWQPRQPNNMVAPADPPRGSCVWRGWLAWTAAGYRGN